MRRAQNNFETGTKQKQACEQYKRRKNEAHHYIKRLQSSA